MRVLILFIFLIQIIHGSKAQESPSAKEKIYETINNLNGKPFPKFHLRDLENKSVSNAKLKGKVVVLNLWFIGCAPCVKEIPVLNEVTDRFAGNERVIFLGLALDEQERLKKFLISHPFHYRVLHSARPFLVDELDIQAYPVHLILDQEGIVRFIKTGDLSDGNELSENIRAILDR